MIIDVVISVFEIGLYVNVLLGVYRVEVIDNYCYYVVNNYYYCKYGNCYVVVDLFYKKVKKVKYYKCSYVGYYDNIKVIVVREGC